MLAVKLHKRKKPKFRKLSFLIPIFTWDDGELLINKWLKMLNHHNTGGRNDSINYISLVKIPDDHPVFLAVDWSEKFLVPINFKPWNKISQKKKKDSMNTSFMPELILGKKLPSDCIKWTKDIRLLYDLNTQKKSKNAKMPNEIPENY